MVVVMFWARSMVIDVEEFSGAGMTFEVGAGNMIPGFDDAVRGCPKGESATFAHTPSDASSLTSRADLEVTAQGRARA